MWDRYLAWEAISYEEQQIVLRFTLCKQDLPRVWWFETKVSILRLQIGELFEFVSICSVDTVGRRDWLFVLNVDSNFEWSHACCLITILYYLHAIARRDTSKNCLSGCPTHLNMFIIFDLPTFWLDDPWFVLFVKTSGSRACQAKGSRDGCREEGWECCSEWYYFNLPPPLNNLHFW